MIFFIRQGRSKREVLLKILHWRLYIKKLIIELKVRTLDSYSLPSKNRSFCVSVEEYIKILRANSCLLILHLLSIHHKFKHISTSRWDIWTEIAHSNVSIFPIFTTNTMVKYTTIGQRREELCLPISISLTLEPVGRIVIWGKWYLPCLDDNSKSFCARDNISRTSRLIGSRDKSIICTEFKCSTHPLISWGRVKFCICEISTTLIIFWQFYTWEF